MVTKMEHHFDIDHAERFGILEAVLISNFQFWIAKNMANNTNFHDGRYWTFNSISAYQKLFPYVSSDKIRRAIDKLVAEGVLMKGNYNPDPMLKTSWYALTDEYLPLKLPNSDDLASLPNASGKTARAIKDNKQTYNVVKELQQEIFEPEIVEAQPVDDFEYFWGDYGYKKDRKSAERAWKKLSASEKRKAVDYIPAYKQDCISHNREMRYPATYLNQATWENEIVSSPTTGNGIVDSAMIAESVYQQLKM